MREKLDLIEFPQDAKRPVILRFDPSSDPIVRVQLHGGMTLARLRDVAEREIKKRLEAVDGVAAVKVAGGRDEQIRIEIDERRVAELGIPITRVTEILRQENLNQASGSLYDLDLNYMVRMVNEFRTVDEVRRIVIADRDGRKTLLQDIARVWRGSRERDIIARHDGEESVELAIYKEGDANTVTVSRAVQRLLDAMRSEATFPEGAETSIVFDQARFISDSVNNVLLAAILGGLLATAILFVFLRDSRSTAIIAASIPISVMATFAAMYQAEITLNIMSLGGVALGVGMLVDNSIVVLEAVHRHRTPGTPLAEAVYAGTSEVSMPVVASTLTTVAVFLPLVFVEGIAGQLFRDQALTITFSLLASLAVALTVIPMLLSARLRQAESVPAGFSERSRGWARRAPLRQFVAAVRFVAFDVPLVLLGDLRRVLRAASKALLRAAQPALDAFDRALRTVSQRYAAALEHSLDRKGAVLGFVCATVMAAAALLAVVGAELIPPLAQGEFSFVITLPQGRPLESTDEVMRAVESEARRIPDVATVFSSVGGTQESQFSSSELEEHVATLHVVMADRSDRTAEAAAISRIRDVIADIPEADQKFKRTSLFSLKTPIEVEIFAFDLADQRAAANLVAARLARIEGIRDIETTSRLGNPEVHVRFDRRRLSRLGLQEDQVASVLRNKIRGDVASQYREGDRQIDILVRVDEPDRNAIDDIRNMVVNSAPRTGSAAGARNGAERRTTSQVGGRTQEQGREASSANRASGPRSFVPIRLGQVADIEVTRGPAEIRRVRSQRAAVVSANLSGRDLSSASAEIREALADLRPATPGRVNGIDRRAASGTGGVVPEPGFRPELGGLPRLPGHGIAVRVLVASVRHPANRPVEPDRSGIRPSTHGHGSECGRVAGSHRAGGHRRQQLDRAGRLHEPLARARPPEARGAAAGRPSASASDSDDILDDPARPGPDGIRLGRGRRGQGPHGDRGYRRAPRLNAPDADCHTSGLRSGGSQAHRQRRRGSCRRPRIDARGRAEPCGAGIDERPDPQFPAA